MTEPLNYGELSGLHWSKQSTQGPVSSPPVVRMNAININFTYIGDLAKPWDLKLARIGDSGFDLIITEKIFLPPNSPQLIPHHIAIQLPEGYEAQIRPRSSTLFKRLVYVQFGSIDQAFTGHLQTCAMSFCSEGTTLEAGSSISQLVVVPCVSSRVKFIEVDKLQDTERGSNGFGSTGK